MCFQNVWLSFHNVCQVYEPYLVKSILKVQKMKYNQVCLLASLTFTAD